LPKELSKALSAVEDARVEYMKAQAKIAVEASPDLPVSSGLATSFDQEYGFPEERGFKYWAKSGFAFTLPLQIIGVLGLIIWLWTIFGPR
jgi:hypothetical protein